MTSPSCLPSPELLGRLFDAAPDLHEGDGCFSGTGCVNGRPVAIIGTANRVHISASIATQMARAVLDVVTGFPGRPIVLLVSNSGQKLSRFDELMGNNGYIAHLTSCIDLAKRQGHRVIGLVTDLAISGGFMATGMATDLCFALDGAEMRVMAPSAMARVTKIPEDRLAELLKTSPAMAPGVENFVRVGAIEAIWSGELKDKLAAALDSAPSQPSHRRQAGEARQGRSQARLIADMVRSGQR